jgi:putative spermidine/putrescine transport system ATP-binding protein
MNKGCVEQIAKPHEAYEWPASAFVANFLGRTNALGARILQDAEGSRILVGAAAWPAGAALPPGPVTLTIRPEKIAFAAAGGLAGTVRSRIFQGTQWLFQIDTEAGATTVIRQNDGAVQPSEGAAVHLAWNAEDMSILPGEDRR